MTRVILWLVIAAAVLAALYEVTRDQPSWAVLLVAFVAAFLASVELVDRAAEEDERASLR